MKKLQVNYFIKALSLIAIALFASCSKDSDGPDNPGDDSDDSIKKYETERVTGNGYDVVYRYNEDVIVYDSQSISYINKIESDTVFYFSKDMPEGILPKSGSILSSTDTSVVPCGLGHEVISIEDAGEYYKCLTTPASLNMIFAELELSAVIIPEESISGVAKLGGVESRGADCDAGAYSDLAFDMKPSLDLCLDIAKPSNNSINLGLHLDLNGEFGVNGGFNKEIKIFGLDDPKALGVWVVGPVVLRPFIDLGVNLVATIEGDIMFRISKKMEHQSGYKNGEGYQELIGSKESEKIISDVAIDASGSVGPEVEIKVGLGVYTTKVRLGLNLTLNMDFSTEFRLNNPNLFKDAPALDFDLKCGGGVFAEVDLFNKKKNKKDGDDDKKQFGSFGFEKEIVSKNLLHHKWRLLPTLDDGSFKLKRSTSSEYAIDAEYSLIGGLLSNFFEIIPAVHVYESGNEVYYKTSGDEADGGTNKVFEFELEGLDNEKQYGVCPSLLMFGKMYDHDIFYLSEIAGKWRSGDEVITFNADGTWHEIWYNDDEYGTVEYNGTYWLDTSIKTLYKKWPNEISEFRYYLSDDCNTLKLVLKDDPEHGTTIYSRVE